MARGTHPFRRPRQFQEVPLGYRLRHLPGAQRGYSRQRLHIQLHVRELRLQRTEHLSGQQDDLQKCGATIINEDPCNRWKMMIG